MDHTHSARGDNPEDEDSSKRRIPAIWPEVGALNVPAWGELFGVTDEAVNKYLKKFNIRHKRAGETNWIRPADMWEAIPFIGEEDPPPKNRR